MKSNILQRNNLCLWYGTPHSGHRVANREKGDREREGEIESEGARNVVRYVVYGFQMQSQKQNLSSSAIVVLLFELCVYGSKRCLFTQLCDRDSDSYRQWEREREWVKQSLNKTMLIRLQYMHSVWQRQKVKACNNFGQLVLWIPPMFTVPTRSSLLFWLVQ